MKNKLIVHGLKRSGNHAIINWLRHHEYFYFFNNIIPVRAILDGTKLHEPEDFDDWFRQKVLPKHLPLANRLMRPIIKKRSLLLSLEDLDCNVKPFLNLPNDFYNVLIIRDPYNLFASRIRKAFTINHPAYPRQNGPHMERALNLWKSHAKEYLGQNNILKNKVCIYYNEWFTNIEYRKNISRQLNLNFTDNGHSIVSATGGGSSFDKTTFDGNSNKMNVLHRKDDLSPKERQLWESVIDDQELQSLALQITKFTKLPN